MALKLVTPVYRIEDSDERISYQGDWKKNQDLPYATFYNGRDSPGIARVSFQRTSISVNAFTYSWNTSEASKSITVGFRIDGQLTVEHIVPHESWIKLQTVYRSPDLPLGVHTLEVEASQAQRTSLGLDYFQVQVQKPYPSKSATPSRGPPLEAIVGGALGGAFSVGALLVLWFIFSRRRQRRKPTNVSDAQPSALFHAPTVSVPRRFTKSQISAVLSRVPVRNGESFPSRPCSTALPTPREQQEVIEAMQTIRIFLPSNTVTASPSNSQERAGEVPPPYDANLEMR